MANIGVVCEGLHDFEFLAPLVDHILKQNGHTFNRVEALQPRVDATSMQIDGGGYEAVCQWLLVNRAVGLNKFLEQPLFSSSLIYDYIIIQLDGDVADLSPMFKSSAFAGFPATVPARVAAVDGWLRSLAAPIPEHYHRLITAVPTLETEAWILAVLRPGRANIEARTRKRTVKRILKNNYAGNRVQQVQAVAAVACSSIAAMASGCQSFAPFYAQLSAI